MRPSETQLSPAQLLAILSFFMLMVACSDKAPKYNPGLFVKVDSVNPILTPGSGRFKCPILEKEIPWENKDVFNPSAIVKDGKVWLMYRAEDTIGRYNGTSRIGMAVSDDGLHFTRLPEPVLYPDHDEQFSLEWEGGIEDPRVVKRPEGGYYMTYTSYDGKIARLCQAKSEDLLTWKKLGTVLTGSYTDHWSKSGAVVVEPSGSDMIAKKISGKYWMYFGDTDLFMAWSEDLEHWTPLEENGQLVSVLKPRPGKFDSRLVESGPYAIWSTKEILLLYNGMNLDQGGAPDLPAGAYSSGKSWFDPQKPLRLIRRSENYFLRPDKPYEILGQVNQVCFIEGLVFFKNKWFLYYGTADSKIAVAVAENDEL